MYRFLLTAFCVLTGITCFTFPLQAEILRLPASHAIRAVGRYVCVQEAHRSDFRLARLVTTRKRTKIVKTVRKKLVARTSRHVTRLKRQLRKRSVRRDVGLRQELRKQVRAERPLLKSAEICGNLNAAMPACSTTAAPMSAIPFIPMRQGQVRLTPTSSCSKAQTPFIEILSSTQPGAAITGGDILAFTFPSALHTHITYRACARAPSPTGAADKSVCSPPVVIEALPCALQAPDFAATVTEGTLSLLALPVGPHCYGGSSLEVSQAPLRGTLQISGTTVHYNAQYLPGSDHFRYRICSDILGDCSEQGHVYLEIVETDSFSGEEEVLDPYREHISEEEHRYIIWKLGGNRQDLLQQSGISLSRLLEDYLLNLESVSPKLRGYLQSIQAAGLVYPRPRSSEAYIPDWQADFGANDEAPVLGPNLRFNTSAQQRYGLERFLTTYTRGRHPNNLNYTWNASHLYAYQLYRSRYLSPLQVNLVHFWMGHFGTSQEPLSGAQEHLIGAYIRNLEKHGMKNFKDLVLGQSATGCAPNGTNNYGIICDYVSQQWLDNDSNRRDRGPNENFAREFMELYLLSPIDEATNLSNYHDTDDVAAATRFLSGFRLSGGSFVSRYSFEPSLHFSTPQSAFLQFQGIYPELVIENRSLTPREFASHIIERHPGARRFIAGKLFSTFVYPDPSPALVAELGELLGYYQWDINRFLLHILRSEAMFSPRAAQRTCVYSPFQVFSKIFNATELPLAPFISRDQANNFLKASIDDNLRSSGESMLAYPSVFSYDYCGRDKGKTGATAWLGPYQLAARASGVTDMLNDIRSRHAATFDYADYAEEAALALSAGGVSRDVASITADEFLHFILKKFNVTVKTEELEILRSYMNQSVDSSGALVDVAWNAGSPNLVRAKVAGLFVILALHPQTNT